MSYTQFIGILLMMQGSPGIARRT